MRNVNEIITRNALHEIDYAAKRALEEGRKFDERVLAARMAEYLELPVDSVQKGLHRYLRQGNPWRVDYVEALARSIGRDVEWMVRPHSPKDVREATSSQMLVSAVDARLDQAEARALARRLNQILDHRPFFDLVSRVIDVLLDAKSAESAALDVSDEVRKSAAWSGKIRSLRGKLVSDKKSS